MPPKRKRGNEDALAADITPTKEEPTLTILTLMKTYDFSIEVLMDRLTEKGLDVNFSRVKFSDIAHFVGLDRHAALRDIDTFELHRSRIPTALFKEMVKDMDLMLMQYGTPVEHQTEEASSRFIAPIFNHLLGQFNFAIKNAPETTLHGCISTKGRIEYQFVTFSGVALVFVEVKLGTGSREEYLNAIAQIIAESGACDWNNSQEGVSMPIFGILCDGVSFEFYKYDGSLDPPTFSKGRLSAGSQETLVAFPLARLDMKTPNQPFIRSLRLVSEIIFDLLLVAYSSSLTAYRKRSISKATETGKPRKSVRGWEGAIDEAIIAQQMFRDGERKRNAGHIQEANADSLHAMLHLAVSTDAVPAIYRLPSLMDSWVDADVESILYPYARPICAPDFKSDFKACNALLGDKSDMMQTACPHIWDDASTVDSDVLVVKGKIIGVISWLSPLSFETAYYREGREGLKAVFRLAEHIGFLQWRLFDPSRNTQHLQQDTEERVMRTMLADGPFGHEQPLAVSAQKIIQICGEEEEIETELRKVGSGPLSEEISQKKELLERCRQWSLVVQQKRLFLCHGSGAPLDLGLAPKVINKGDLVCLLRGSKTPCILRSSDERGGRYRVIGQCYLDEWMYGSPPLRRNWSSSGEQKFVLV